MIGQPHQEMFEACTLLGALAARTQRLRLSHAGHGRDLPPPVALPKAVTALDVISSGRALLGIGAAWFELEHQSLGFEFPPLTVRYEHLMDALEICRGMFTQEATTYRGTHHSVTDACNTPAPINGEIPIMVGRQGERTTFRLAAQYFHELNTTAAFADLPPNLEVLQGHLDDLGRDRADITVAPLATLVVAPTHEEAEAELQGLFASRGTDLHTVLGDPPLSAMAMARMV